MEFSVFFFLFSPLLLLILPFFDPTFRGREVALISILHSTTLQRLLSGGLKNILSLFQPHKLSEAKQNYCGYEDLTAYFYV